MNDDSSHAGPSDEVPRFAAQSMVSPGLQAALKASTDAAFRPLMADVTKAVLGAGLPKAFLGGGVSKAVLGVGLPRPELGGFARLAAGTMVSPGLQAALKASTDARFRPLMEGLSKSILGAGLPNPVLGEIAKLAARPVFHAAIDVPAGRTLSERARFTDLLGKAAKLPPAGTDGQAALADLAQRQAERQAAAHEADQAIVELRDQFEQLVTILQQAQQDQRLEARVNRRLAIATLAATILLALLSYLLPPRSATTTPTPTAPPPSVTSPSSEGSTPRQVPPTPSKPQKHRSDTT